MIDGIIAMFRGMLIPIKHLFVKRRVTVEYPFKRRPAAARYHGRHILNRHEDGLEKCIGCELCAGACPADAILVIGAPNPPSGPIAPGERYGAVYQINMLRCVFCGLCVEACPTEAITMTTFHEFTGQSRDTLIYDKAELLQAPPGPERVKMGWKDRTKS